MCILGVMLVKYLFLNYLFNVTLFYLKRFRIKVECRTLTIILAL